MGQFAVRVLILLAADGQALDFDIPQEGCRLATLEDLHLDGSDGAPSRLLISLTARADSVARTTGRGSAHQGTSGTCSQRLSWIGDAPSRWIRTWLRRDARRVNWRLSIHSSPIKDLSISARVDDIERLSDSLEAAFGAPLQGT